MRTIGDPRKEFRLRRCLAAKPRMLIPLLLFLDIFIPLLVVLSLPLLKFEQPLQDVGTKSDSRELKEQDVAPTGNLGYDRLPKGLESLEKWNEVDFASKGPVELIVCFPSQNAAITQFRRN